MDKINMSIRKTGMENKNNRVKWLQKTLERIEPGRKILDAGAGELQYRELCSHLIYVSQDFGKYTGIGDSIGLQKDRKWEQDNLDIISDITSIPEESSSFDVIMCIEVIEHVPDPMAAIKELTRLLKPGGELILTAPFCSLSHFTPYYYYSGFSRHFYEYALEGYEILEVDYNGNFYEWLAQELRRIPKVSEKYGDGKLPFYFKLSLSLMLKVLNFLSSRNKNSEDLLCYGLHVRAKKLNKVKSM